VSKSNLISKLNPQAVTRSISFIYNLKFGKYSQLFKADCDGYISVCFR